MDRINQTSEWIISEFKKRKCDVIVCLGDVLNTREQVSVRSLSSALNFFDRLRAETKVPIHIILGNHDMNLKHSGKISSLDFFGLELMKTHGFHLHRNIDVVNILGQDCIMIPYHEDQSIIEKRMEELKEEFGINKMKNTLVFGHLSITGASPNNSKNKYIGGINASVFDCTKRTFTGHFHHHHAVNNVIYVGAPLQFNFGDCGDKRGVVIYNSNKNYFNYVVNPLCYQFLKINDIEIDNIIKRSPGVFKDAFVKVLITQRLPAHHFENIREKLFQLGARSVYEEQVFRTILEKKSGVVDIKHQNLEDLLHEYLLQVRKEFLECYTEKAARRLTITKYYEHILVNDTLFQNLLEKGISVVRRMNDMILDSTKEGDSFHANLEKLTIENFLGVQGVLELPFGKLNDGIWSIEGKNGAGKSTIFEAIVWCQFGQFIRSGMQKDYCINDNFNDCRVRLEYSNGLIIERKRKRGRYEALKTYKKNVNAQVDESNIEFEYQEEKELGHLNNTQMLLNQTLGIDFSTFTKSIVLGQNIVNNFVSGSKEERRKIIEDLLGLDKLDDLLEETKEERIEIDREITAINEKIKSNKLELDRILKQIEQVESKIEEKKIILAEEEVKVEKREKDREETMNLLNKKLYKARNNLKQLQDSYNKIENIDVYVLQKLVIEFQTCISHLSNVNKENSSVCPGCGQSISQEHIKTLVDHLRKLMFNYETGNFVSSEMIDPPNNDVVMNPTKLIQKGNGCIRHIQRRIESQKMKTSLENQITNQKLILSKIENEILKKESESNVLSEDIMKNVISYKTEINVLNEQLEELGKIKESIESIIASESEALKQKMEEFTILKFWEMSFDKRSRTGFKTIRAFVVEDAITNLNQIIRSYTDLLSESQKLQVTLTPDLNVGEIYAKRSGGERKRTDLAVLFSLFELIRARSKYIPQFIILDEIFDSLDTEGRQLVAQVLTLLSERLKKIFIVTHSDVASSLPLAGTLSVTMKKDEKGKPIGSEMKIFSV